MPERNMSRRAVSERRLCIHRTVKDFCAFHALPVPTIQFRKGSSGYLFKDQIIDLDKDEKDEDLFHALGHHRYFLIHGFKDRFMTRLDTVCLICGISLIFFERNPLPLLLFLVPYSHLVIRQIYAERYVPRGLRSITRWLRLLLPFGK